LRHGCQMEVRATPYLEHASRVRPCQGEEVSGDTVFFRPLEEGLFVAIVDVLGHGPQAHELAIVIEEFLADSGRADIASEIASLHEHLKGTRGAAVGFCEINAAEGRAAYVGTGNTVMRRFGKTNTRLISQDGILGQNMRTPRPQTLQLEPEDLIVLYTDGVHDRFTVDDYPSIFHHSPKNVARTIVERFGKSYDDAACIAVRYAP